MTGDAVPGVGTIVDTDEVVVNDDGSWCVWARTDHPDYDTDRVLLENGTRYLREGDPIAPGAFVREAGLKSLNRPGHLASIIELTGTAGSFDDHGVYFDRNLVLQEGTITTATNFTLGTSYIDFQNLRLNDRNQMLVQCCVDDPAITGGSDNALLLFSLDASGAIVSERVLAVEGSLLPFLLDPVRSLGNYWDPLALNGLGDALFLVNTTGPIDANGAILLNDRVVALEGGPSGVPGRPWTHLGSTALDLNDNRDWVCTGKIAGDSDTYQLLVRNGLKFRQTGDTLPAIAPFLLLSIDDPVFLTNSGEVVWWAWWDQPDPDHDTGLFIDDELLVHEGVTTVGGVPVDQIIRSPHHCAISPNGRYFVFSAVLEDGRDGVYVIDRGIRGTAAMRNGEGENDILFSSTSRPRLGGPWTAEVDNSAHPGAITLVHGYGAGIDGLLLAWGELLVNPLSPHLFLSQPIGGTTAHVQAVPSDIAFLGGVVSTQAVVLSSPPLLTNAIDLVLGW